MRASTRTHITCSHVVKAHYRTPQLDAFLHPLRNVMDKTNLLLQEFRFNLNRELSLFAKSLMQPREGEFWSSPRRQDNAFDSELVIWWDWIEVNTSWPVLRAEDHPSPLPVPPNPIKPSFLTIPPSYSLIPGPTNVPLLPPPLSERSLDYTNGHDRKDSPSLSCKLHSLRPNQTSRKQEHTSRPECIILAVK